MIALNFKIDETITGAGQFIIWDLLKYYPVNSTYKKFYPKFQQNELTLIINLKNTGSIATEIEVGIEENLSVNNKIPLIKTNLQAGEIKSFLIKTDIFLRTLEKDNPVDYYYAVYYNVSASVNVEAKGLFNLSVKNKIIQGVPY